MSEFDPVTKEGGFFDEYIDTFLKLKTQASGLPEQFSSVDDFVEDIFLKEGIRLDREKIK